MASLVVRGLDERIVQALKRRAAAHQRSAEAEHRAIMEEALMRPRRKTLAEALAEVPEVGREDDFARKDERDAHDVFD